MTTSGLLADLVSNVAGDRAEVTNLVPDGADLHTYEPTLRQTRDVANANIAFTHFTVEERSSMTRLLDANLSDRARNLNLNDAANYGVQLLPSGGTNGVHSHSDDDHGHVADEENSHSGNDQAHGTDEDHSRSHDGHAHGKIDPHIWQNVNNAHAYVKMVTATLAELDPENGTDYRENARRYGEQLERLDDYVRTTIAAIPRDRRKLVTTHNGFAYLEHAYGIRPGGFITAGTETEPSLAARRDLAATIKSEKVPAVFIESNLKERSSTLREIAEEVGAAVCTIYGDAFDERIGSYEELMRFNADSLKRCLYDD